MVINEAIPFNVTEVDKINNDRVIVVNSNHYIAKYLSTYELSPITKDGMRFNLIDGLDMSSDLVNFEIYKVPTGVTPRNISTHNPKALLFRNKLIYINGLGSTDDLNLYVRGNLVASISAIEPKDRLIILTSTEFEAQVNHEIDVTPHQFDRIHVTKSNISSYSNITEIMTLGSDSIQSGGDYISSPYITQPPFVSRIVGYQFNPSTKLMDPITRRYDSPYTAINRKNSYLD